MLPVAETNKRKRKALWWGDGAKPHIPKCLDICFLKCQFFLDSPFFQKIGLIQFLRFKMTSPLSRARTASSVRLRKPVFSNIFRICVLTVATDMFSRSAIS